MVRALGMFCIMVLGLVALAAPAVAQSGNAGAPILRVEPEVRQEYARPGVVTGWIYNDGQAVAGLVRMKAEMLDDTGKVVAEHLGWAYGNVAPNGRAYFMIRVPPNSPPQRRVLVESYVLQSYAPRAESP
jgi:hypothetical protein